MGTKSGEVVESAGVYTVLRLFPERRVLVKQLLTRDESFRAMCDDLAAAESALGAVDRLPGHIRSGRRAEYEELVQSLVTEIEMTLRRAKIVPIA